VDASLPIEIAEHLASWPLHSAMDHVVLDDPSLRPVRADEAGLVRGRGGPGSLNRVVRSGASLTWRNIHEHLALVLWKGILGSQ
jgi:hypothetical protein